MAKNNNLNIVEQERRAKKAKEIKKAKEQRNKEKLERLSQIDPRRLQRRISDLEAKKQRNNGRLLINEQRQLESLQKDLEYLTKKNLIKDEPIEPIQPKEETKPIELGSRSIFWDPEWNPLGTAPKGFKNMIYPLSKQDAQFDPEVAEIPIPKSPPPRFFKIQEAQTTYESKPEINVSTPSSDTTTKFIPSVVRGKVQKVNIQSESSEVTNDADNEDMAGYASEEEESLINMKRKADELDDEI